MSDFELPIDKKDEKQDDISVHLEAEYQANNIELAIFGAEQNADKSTELIASFISSYNNRGEKSQEQWLIDEFRKYPGIWENEEELQSATHQVLESTNAFNKSRESLQQHMDKGRSKASWLAGEIEKNAAITGSVNVGQYASSIEQALAQASKNAEKIITTRIGEVNFNPNLDGFIAEQHHVDTFNIDAVTKGSSYRAHMVNSRELNSVDIKIVDGGGNEVANYQSKYGADAKATSNQFEGGDYQDQKRLVPEGHSADVPKSSEVIEEGGVKSRPLSKEDAKAQQKKAQADAEARKYEWNDTSRIEVAKNIGKQALVGACIAAGMQGVRILARRAWNKFNGRKNPSVNEDLKEFFESSLRTATQTAVQVAVSGAVVVAVKNGWFGKALSNTPAGRITNIVCVGLQNAKTLYQLGKGELTQSEALDEIANTVVTTSMAIAGATEGAALGAAIGTVFGPVGTAIGGFVGGVTGGIVSGQIGEVIYQAGKVVAKTALKVTIGIVEGAGQVMESFGRAISDKVSFFK